FAEGAAKPDAYIFYRAGLHTQLDAHVSCPARIHVARAAIIYSDRYDFIGTIKPVKTDIRTQFSFHNLCPTAGFVIIKYRRRQFGYFYTLVHFCDLWWHKSFTIVRVQTHTV